mmetsp:Transcript_26869/g.70940  ORF Transcript_26869/g.70940 Transcript_26869/m.70940 type:complete len:562 (-) Transcript_26869:70-1755(-)
MDKEVPVRQGRPQLKISILSAKGLRAADFNFSGGSSDPYCVARVVDRPQSTFKTEIIRKCLEPVWDFEGTAPVCGEGDAVEFEVYDYDAVGSDDLLGKARIEYEDFAAYGFDGDVELSEAGGKEVATLRVKLELLPESAVYDKREDRVFVRLVSAGNLRAADWNGKSDPFATAEIVGKPESRISTKVQSKCLSPVWDEEDELRGFDWEGPDSILIQVWDHDDVSSPDRLGKLVLKPGDFYPGGWDVRTASMEGLTPFMSGGKIKLGINLMLGDRTPPKIDPGLNVGPEDKHPAPFQVKSLDTGLCHRLVGYTVVGRSERMLDPRTDLILKGPGVEDISRVHAVIKCWQNADPMNWSARVYDEKGGGGATFGPGGGHAGGGTCVDGEPVDPDVGTAVEPGCIIRFGLNELWVVERAAIHQRSYRAAVAINRARQNAVEDPSTFRALKIPTAACVAALRHCDDWDSMVRVVLEWCGQPDEPPCVDVIEVQDETGRPSCRHVASTIEAQLMYNVKQILPDLRMGATIRLRLSSDPCLLAPIMLHMEKHRAMVEAIHEERASALF